MFEGAINEFGAKKTSPIHVTTNKVDASQLSIVEMYSFSDTVRVIQVNRDDITVVSTIEHVDRMSHDLSRKRKRNVIHPESIEAEMEWHDLPSPQHASPPLTALV